MYSKRKIHKLFTTWKLCTDCEKKKIYSLNFAWKDSLLPALKGSNSYKNITNISLLFFLINDHVPSYQDLFGMNTIQN